MKVDTADLKSRVDFREIVSQTTAIDRAGKIHCPHHDDGKPSYQVYENGGWCFSCGTGDDHISWLEKVHGLSTKAAIAELEARAGVRAAPLAHAPVRAVPKPRDRSCDAKPITEAQRTLQFRRAARTTEVPEALKGRGFVVDDLLALGIVAENGDALFPVAAPGGEIVAIKRRRAVPEPCRYEYVTPGHGTPAWCSPGFLERAEVLIIEGELNGMACWLAKPSLAVMGAAGAGHGLHLGALRGKTVFVYADGDEPGQRARTRWAEQAHRAGAAKVFLVAPWDDGDACDVMGRFGREALRERLS